MKSNRRADAMIEMARTMPVSKIAEELGVSKSLVRYHINGGKNGKYRKKRSGIGAKQTKAELSLKENGIFPHDFSARRLSLKECCSFMDIPEAYESIAGTVTKAKGYKIAGNAIVKNCLVAVIGQMFEGHENDYKNK